MAWHPPKPPPSPPPRSPRREQPWWARPAFVPLEHRQMWLAACNEVNDHLGGEDLVPMSYWELQKAVQAVPPPSPFRTMQEAVDAVLAAAGVT